MALLTIDTQLSREYLERTGAVPRETQVADGTEHNPHLRARMQERRMGFTGRRGPPQPWHGDGGDAAAPRRPSRRSNMGAPVS